MIYVDENLCTGCGICIDACNQGALSIAGCAAVIDPTLCTSCGRCIDACLTEAIICVETIPEYPPTSVPAQRPEAQPLWAGTRPLSPDAVGAAVTPAASPAPRSAATSKLDVVQKVLSGVLSVAAFALNRKQGRSVISTALKARTGTGAAVTGAGGTGCSGRRQAGRGGRGLGGGQGLGGGRGQATRRNRTT
jgi:NAD-dependent dihydropyrimidine dehydrogenase PreA subunit